MLVGEGVWCGWKLRRRCKGNWSQTLPGLAAGLLSVDNDDSVAYKNLLLWKLHYEKCIKYQRRSPGWQL